MIAPAQSTRRHLWLVFLGVTVVVLALLLSTAATVGVTWDEPIYSQAAENAAHWFGTLLLRGGPAAAFAQTAFGVGWGLVNEHPPLVRVLNGFGWVLTRGSSRRRPCIASGVCCSPRSLSACWPRQRAALRVGRRPVCRCRRRGDASSLLPRPSRRAGLPPRRDLVSGYAGVLLCRVFPPVVGAVAGRAGARPGAPDEDRCGPARAVLGLSLSYHRRSGRAWLVFLLSLPVALLVLVAGWPWIWRDPAAGLVNWVKFFRVHFARSRQWYAGKLYVKTPWYLAPVMVGITTPGVADGAGSCRSVQQGSEDRIACRSSGSGGTSGKATGTACNCSAS